MKSAIQLLLVLWVFIKAAIATLPSNNVIHTFSSDNTYVTKRVNLTVVMWGGGGGGNGNIGIYGGTGAYVNASVFAPIGTTVTIAVGGPGGVGGAQAAGGPGGAHGGGRGGSDLFSFNSGGGGGGSSFISIAGTLVVAAGGGGGAGAGGLNGGIAGDAGCTIGSSGQDNAGCTSPATGGSFDSGTGTYVGGLAAICPAGYHNGADGTSAGIDGPGIGIGGAAFQSGAAGTLYGGGGGGGGTGGGGAGSTEVSTTGTQGTGGGGGSSGCIQPSICTFTSCAAGSQCNPAGTNSPVYDGVAGHCATRGLVGISECIAGYIGNGWTCVAGPCFSSPCLNGASCVAETAAGYTCTCAAGYSGQNCQTDINECASAPCQNGGTCIDHSNSFTCGCVSGFTGTLCQSLSDVCTSQPCQHGGTCVQTLTTYTCQCIAGYSGDKCQTDVNECASSPCQNGGTCIDNLNRFNCTCASGFSGTACQFGGTGCASNPCRNGGSCSTTQSGGYLCTCTSGFGGNQCENIVVCRNNVVKVFTQDGYFFTTRDKFTAILWGGGGGSTFSVHYPGTGALLYASVTTPAGTNVSIGVAGGGSPGGTLNGGNGGLHGGGGGGADHQETRGGGGGGGASYVIINGKMVMAVGGGGGVGMTELNNPTALGTDGGNGGCQTGSDGGQQDCVHAAKGGSYNGVSGLYVGGAAANCAGLVDVPGSPGTGSIINGSVIGLGGPGAVFLSEPVNGGGGGGGGAAGGGAGNGYKSSSLAAGTGGAGGGSGCIEPSICTFTSCSVGGVGTAAGLTDPLYDGIAGGVALNFTAGNRGLVITSECASTFFGDGCFCDPGPCGSTPCQHSGTCISPNTTSYTCQCAAGYTGINCQTDINECASFPCLNGATCFDLPNGFACNCTSSFIGALCQTPNPCVSIPCSNGGSCVPILPSSFACVCVTGYSGTVCQTNVNECASAPCQNGATCNDLVNFYTCTCIPGYTGLLCQTNVNECGSSPCTNGGTCTDGLNSFVCQCVDGFGGARCQTKLDRCASSPCMNAATCTAGNNNYTCQCRGNWIGTTCGTCPAGYSGSDCQTDINECASNPCQNGGTCIDSLNSFTCVCTSHFRGTLCDLLPCTSNPCQNGGACSNTATGYSCTCNPGTIGFNCQTVVDNCVSRPCQNGGICVNGVGSYTCSCQIGFSGPTCSTEANQFCDTTGGIYSASGVIASPFVSTSTYLSATSVTMATWARAAAINGEVLRIQVSDLDTVISGLSIQLFGGNTLSYAVVFTDVAPNVGFGSVGPQIWFHVALTMSFTPDGGGGGTQLAAPYLNGAPLTGANRHVSVVGASTAQISVSLHQCEISQLRFYKTILTAPQIAAGATLTNPVWPTPGLYYPFSLPFTQSQTPGTVAVNVGGSLPPLNMTGSGAANLLWTPCGCNNTNRCQNGGYCIDFAVSPSVCSCISIPHGVYSGPVCQTLTCSPGFGPGTTNCDTCLPGLFGENCDKPGRICNGTAEIIQTCGYGTESCVIRCNVNHTVCQGPLECHCIAGLGTTDPLHCGYLFQSDVCTQPNPPDPTFDYQISICGVFVNASASTFICPNNGTRFEPDKCVAECVCKAGSGQTVDSQYTCGGFDEVCNPADVRTFCTSGQSACTKRCEYLPNTPNFREYCVFTNGSCVDIPGQTFEVCTPSEQLSLCGPDSAGCISLTQDGVVTDFQCFCRPGSVLVTGGRCELWATYDSSDNSTAAGSNCSIECGPNLILTPYAAFGDAYPRGQLHQCGIRFFWSKNSAACAASLTPQQRNTFFQELVADGDVVMNGTGWNDNPSTSATYLCRFGIRNCDCYSSYPIALNVGATQPVVPVRSNGLPNGQVTNPTSYVSTGSQSFGVQTYSTYAGIETRIPGEFRRVFGCYGSYVKSVGPSFTGSYCPTGLVPCGNTCCNPSCTPPTALCGTNCHAFFSTNLNCGGCGAADPRRLCGTSQLCVQVGNDGQCRTANAPACTGGANAICNNQGVPSCFGPVSPPTTPTCPVSTPFCIGTTPTCTTPVSPQCTKGIPFCLSSGGAVSCSDFLPQSPTCPSPEITQCFGPTMYCCNPTTSKCNAAGQCPAGQLMCGTFNSQSCTTGLSDDNNCGACSNQCDATRNQHCVSGVCTTVCSGGASLCGFYCCGPSDVCTNGICSNTQALMIGLGGGNTGLYFISKPTAALHNSATGLLCSGRGTVVTASVLNGVSFPPLITYDDSTVVRNGLITQQSTNAQCQCHPGWSGTQCERQSCCLLRPQDQTTVDSPFNIGSPACSSTSIPFQCNNALQAITYWAPDPTNPSTPCQATVTNGGPGCCEAFYTSIPNACNSANLVTGGQLYCQHGFMLYTELGPICSCSAGFENTGGTGLGGRSGQDPKAACTTTLCAGSQQGVSCTGHGNATRFYDPTQGMIVEKCVCNRGYIGFCCDTFVGCDSLGCSTGAHNQTCFATVVVNPGSHAGSCTTDSTSTTCTITNFLVPSVTVTITGVSFTCASSTTGSWGGQCCDTWSWNSPIVCSGGGILQDVPTTSYEWDGTNRFLSPGSTFADQPLCVCPNTETSTYCLTGSCPNDCGSHGTCTNGQCRQQFFSGGPLQCGLGGVGSQQFTGCECEIDQFAGCGNTICSSGQGSCDVAYNNQSSLFTYCTCPNTRTGPHCEFGACGAANCNSPQGDCQVGGLCICRTTAASLGNNRVFVGTNCDVDVTTQCGVPNGFSGIMTSCNLHGACNGPFGSITPSDYSCNCTSGFTGSKCQTAPCSPVCTHGVCTPTTGNPVCVCFQKYSIGTGSCSVNTCANGGVPAVPSREAPQGALPAVVCVCTNPALSFASGCTTPVCPQDSNGVICGPVNPNAGGPPPNTNTCGPSGTCSCAWSSAINSTSGLCVPRCSPDTSHTISNNFNIVLGLAVFDSCTCQSGFYQPSGCYERTCLNGGFLSGSTCVCTPGFSGTRCQLAACNGIGTLNGTICNCPSPYFGTQCQSNRCQNSGSPNLGTGGCDCPSSIYFGQFCQSNLCVFGTPNITRCICVTPTITGTYCNISSCLNGGVVDPTSPFRCICPAAFTGNNCGFGACGPGGTFSGGNCTCTSPFVTNDPVTKNCTASLCGPFGALNANFSSCTCFNNTIRITQLSVNQSVYCIPICPPGFVYDNTLINCRSLAPVISSSAAPFSSTGSHFSSTGAPRSSTGSHNQSSTGGGSTVSSSTGPAPHTNGTRADPFVSSESVSIPIAVGVAVLNALLLVAMAVTTSVPNAVLSSTLVAVTTGRRKRIRRRRHAN